MTGIIDNLYSMYQSIKRTNCDVVSSLHLVNLNERDGRIVDEVLEMHFINSGRSDFSSIPVFEHKTEDDKRFIYATMLDGSTYVIVDFNCGVMQ